MTSSSLNLSSQLLVGEMLKRATHKTPHAEAYVYQEQRVTFKEIDERSTKLAAWLQGKGIVKDDKVGFMLKNSMAFPEVAFGVALSGGVGVPINFRLGPSEIEYIVNNSDTKILIIDYDYVDIIRSIRDNLEKVEKVVVVGADNVPDDYIKYESIFDNEFTYQPCEVLADENPCFIVYTSGTTGRPKGAVLTHKNICLNLMNLLYDTKSTLGDSQLIVVPQFHIAGLLLTLFACLTSGKTVIQREFNPVDVLSTVESEGINVLFLVPAMWNFLFQVPNIDDYNLSSLKIASTGAAITPLEVKKRILETFNNAILFDNFGQSETTANTTSNSGEDALRKTESVGKPYINVEVRIVDENMNDVPIGEVGEIVYRGPTVMKEYYKNPEATKEAFEGGWFHSGDLVRMDEEGFIYVVDRKKNMLISGGENIYPAEVEEILYQMPQILECAVIGVPDKEWGESVKAIVVIKPEHTLTEEQVIEYCKKHLASYKKPKVVEFVEELPRNASGKVLKYVLQRESEKMNKN
ncbi:long-chain-fatty-acid--CoA ligase [Oceanobacillus piezotolerans]|uniref:Long-chain-fatty-acid--CoA ligase n=1 Tax=Oceanobacillus piezotolerans TaxID=2448030 RepID=A0A498DQV9_9BACI|nr:long-chain fatty acid--CoA ligase [Oceanobacillus piezotolerans]RLL46859.1 long-chain-fatty-acid--CoA ligase [Oceanobacillus piezotolerans]